MPDQTDVVDASGILSKSLRETPIAILDLETTGLNPGADRVVEISIVRLEPDGSTRLVLDTLVNPLRPMAATEIHGITEEDVAEAPSFAEVAGNVLRELSGCVIAAYNVEFDMRFLQFELAQVKFAICLPHFCIMYLRTMLGLGSRCRLQEACFEQGIEPGHSHAASADAGAAAKLLARYLDLADEKSLTHFGQLPGLRRYSFARSLRADPLPGLGLFNFELCDRLQSRRTRLHTQQFEPRRGALTAYWDTLLTVLSDLEITEDELHFMHRERARLSLREDHVRMLHAKVFSHAITRYIDDEWLDDHEARKLKQLRRCLSQLGWAPGD